VVGTKMRTGEEERQRSSNVACNGVADAANKDAAQGAGYVVSPWAATRLYSTTLTLFVLNLRRGAQVLQAPTRLCHCRQHTRAVASMPSAIGYDNGNILPSAFLPLSHGESQGPWT